MIFMILASAIIAPRAKHSELIYDVSPKYQGEVPVFCDANEICPGLVSRTRNQAGTLSFAV